MALPGLIDTLAQLKVPAMIAYDVATKLLDTESFPQHNIAALISGITFIVLFSSKPLWWKNTHTHTHTHTHTTVTTLVNKILTGIIIVRTLSS